jgi:hypothetical protein
VNVYWLIDEDGQFQFAWEEMGGPDVVAPTRAGFGSQLLQRVLKQLRWSGKYRIPHRRCALCYPRPPVLRGGRGRGTADAAPRRPTIWRGIGARPRSAHRHASCWPTRPTLENLRPERSETAAGFETVGNQPESFSPPSHPGPCFREAKEPGKLVHEKEASWHASPTMILNARNASG